MNQAFDAFKKDCYFPDRLSVDEFLASLIVMSHSELSGESAGSSLAVLSMD
jgi:hypothetical protein